MVFLVGREVDYNGGGIRWTALIRFSRQEYWSGLPFSCLGDLPDPGVEPVSHELAGRFFTTGASGKSYYNHF